MVLAKLRLQKLLKKQTNSSVAVVGIRPDLTNVAGKLSMAGPRIEFTAMESEPNMPMEPE